MDIVTLGAALNGSAEYVNSHFKGGSNIQIVDNPDGTQTINASGEVSSEDTVARAEIAEIKDGETLDSFGDVETALGDKADTSTTYTKTEVDTALSAKANSADVYSKTAVDTALSTKANSADVYSKSDIDTTMSAKADKSTTYTKTEVDTALGDKVDKVQGKGLSTNDFTTVEKTKLDDLAEVKSIGTGLNLDSTTGELTATGGGGGTSDYSDLTNKPQINGNTLSGNKTSAQLGLASASDIPTTLADLSGDSTHRTVSDTEKAAWNNKSDFSGSYNDLTNKPTIPDELSDLTEDATHRTVTDTEKSTWNGKQSALSSAQLDAVNSGIDSTKVAQIATNENNILWNAYKGVKNVLDFQTWVTNCSVVNATKTVGANIINIVAGNSNSYTEYLSNYPATDIRVTEGDIYQLSWTYSRTGGAGRGTVYAYAMNNSDTVITSANAQGTTGKLSITTPTGATKLRISIAIPANTSESYGYMMICLKSLYDANSSYQPYALSNAELTAAIQALQAQLANQ